jgi:hypothetical protein
VDAGTRKGRKAFLEALAHPRLFSFMEVRDMSEREKTGWITQQENGDLFAEVINMAAEIVASGERDIIDTLRLNLKAYR